jgi:hypothetical protein
MLHGAQTARAAYELSAKIDSMGFDVLCAHRDRRVGKDEASRVRFGQTVCWMGSEFRSSSRLAFPDIAVVDRISKRAVLIVEVEENKAQPKLVIADLFALLLGDHVTFGPGHREELKIGSWSTYSILAQSTGNGSGKQQLQWLAARLNEAKNRISTPNASIGHIYIETYQDEKELGEKLVKQTKKALKEFTGT